MGTRIIELTIDDEDIAGVYAMGMVQQGAIEEDFLYLKKEFGENKTQVYELAKIDEEKRLLIGPALIPNKQIIRKNKKTGEVFYLYFSEATVKKAAHFFLKNSAHHNVTLQHENPIEGVYAVESWMIENPEMDKAKHYGFNLNKGTWMTIYKVDNDDFWENEVKTGKVKGFSIEAHFTNKLNEKMSKVIESQKDEFSELEESFLKTLNLLETKANENLDRNSILQKPKQ